MESLGISQILVETNDKGKFLSCIVTDREGFPIASATTGEQNPEVQAAVIGLIRRVTNQASEQLGISSTTEFTLFDANGHLFVCRPFIANGIELALAFLIHGKDRPYRRLMNQTINKIQRTFEI